MEHKIISGGEQYLPFARSRIRALRALGLQYVSQSFNMGDATVNVQLKAGIAYIRIEGGELKYQFFTTGAEALHEPIPLPLAPYAEIRKGYVVTVREDPAQRGVATKASGGASSAEATDTGKWEYVSADDLGSRLKTGMQIQLYQPSLHYGSSGGKLGKSPTISTWNSSSPLQGIDMRGGGNFVFSARTNYLADNLYDIAPKSGTSQVPNTDWYRRAATQTVNDERYGSRKFIIMVDVNNTFHVYPVGQVDDTLVPDADYIDQAIKTNVPDKFVQRSEAPLPEWAAKSTTSSRAYWKAGAQTLQDYYGRVPQYKWAFNSTGKKACCVVYERLNNAFGFFSVGSIALSFIPGTSDRFAVQEALPGLVEVEFTITLTGNKPEEFTFSTALVRNLQPTVDLRYIMAADYSWGVTQPDPNPEVTEPVVVTVLDDLTILVGRIFHTTLTRETAGKIYYPRNHTSTVEVYNLTTSTSIRTFLMNRTNGLYEADFAPFAADLPVVMGVGVKRTVATCVILAMDLRVLAFVLQQKFIEVQTVWNGAQTTFSESTGAKQAQRIKVYMRNVLEDERVMEPLPSTTDDALVAAFADTSVTGLFQWPINEVGQWGSLTPGNNVSAYEQMELLTLFKNNASTVYNDIRQTTTPTILGFTFDAGAYLYATHLSPLVRYDPTGTFVIHPNKSWALSLRPIFYHAGPVVDKDLTGLDLTKFRQTLVDIIRFVNAKGVEIATTHVAEFNKAYGKTTTAADHLYTFTKEQNSGNTKKYIQATTPAGAALLFPISINGDTPTPLPHEFDANYPNFGVILVKPDSEPTRPGMPATPLGSYYSYRPLGDSWAMAGGSSIFHS